MAVIKEGTIFSHSDLHTAEGNLKGHIPCDTCRNVSCRFKADNMTRKDRERKDDLSMRTEIPNFKCKGYNSCRSRNL